MINKGSLKFLVLTIIIVLLNAMAKAQEKRNIDNSAIETSQSLVGKYPDSLKLHQDYLAFFSIKDSVLLMRQYDQWMLKFTHSEIIPLAIGGFFSSLNSPLRANYYLTKAVLIKPKSAEAWFKLANISLLSGKDTLYSQYLGKAVEADPGNLDYQYGYLNSLRALAPDKFDSLYLDLETKHPNTEIGSKALLQLAYFTDNDDLKLSYYSFLYHRYLKFQSVYFRRGMSYYFELLINKGAYSQAFDLALNLVPIIDQNKLEWKYKIKVAKDLVLVNQLITHRKYIEALNILNNIKLEDNNSASRVSVFKKIEILKAEVNDLSNHTETAYTNILKQYSREPSELFGTYLFKYGSKLSKDSIQVKKDIVSYRLGHSKEATKFLLSDYRTSKRISSDQFKGKVVLLTYWFPSCGPCRAELPHFENVIKKFDTSKVSYIAINIDLKENEYILPFINSKKYSFIALKDDLNWDKGNLAARAAPINYLIDQEGRIIYSNFFIDETNESTLELMIKELL